MGLVRGEVVARGAFEVDIYNEDLCDLPFPEGVGRYRWDVKSKLLHLNHIKKDPCATRGGVLDDATYRKGSLMATSLDNGWRSPRKLLRAVVDLGCSGGTPRPERLR